MSSAGEAEWVAPPTPSMRDIVIEAESHEENGTVTFFDATADEIGLMTRWATVDEDLVVTLPGER